MLHLRTRNSWRPIIVHVEYAISSIIEAGVRDEKFTISFAKMIHRKGKMKAQETGTSLPLSTENLLEELDKYDPVKEIYNAISLSGDPLIPENTCSYAAPKSSVKANKIWFDCS